MEICQETMRQFGSIVLFRRGVPMRTAIWVLCLTFGLTAAGETGDKKKKSFPVKFVNVDDQRLVFSTLPNPETKEEGKEFTIKLSETKVVVVDKSGNTVEGGETHLRENVKQLRGKVFQMQIE